MKQFAFAILSLSFSVGALAAQGPQSYKEIYSCFNPAQMTDAAMVSIDVDSKGAQYLHEQSRGFNTYVPVHRVPEVALLDNSTYEAKNVTVLEIAGIENPPKRATVTFHVTGLVYKCTPTAK